MPRCLIGSAPSGSVPAAMAAAFLALGAPAVAHAGPASDALARCAASAPTAAERDRLATWIFVSAAANPKVSGLARATPAQREHANRAMAALVDHILFGVCRREAVEGVRRDGDGAVQAAFAALAETGVSALLQDPAAAGALQGYAPFIDPHRWASLESEIEAAGPDAAKRPLATPPAGR